MEFHRLTLTLHFHIVPAYALRLAVSTRGFSMRLVAFGGGEMGFLRARALSTPAGVSTEHPGRLSATGTKTTYKTPTRDSTAKLAIAPGGTVGAVIFSRACFGGGAESIRPRTEIRW